MAEHLYVTMYMGIIDFLYFFCFGWNDVFPIFLKKFF